MDFEVLWIVAILVFAGLEAYMSVLVSIWFAAGSLVAMIAALFGAQLWLQAVLFVAVSVLLLASLRTVV